MEIVESSPPPKEHQFTVGEIIYGNVFKFEGHFYMRVRLRCAGLTFKKHENMASCINLKHGTARLISKSQPVEFYYSRVSVTRGYELPKDMPGWLEA